VVFPSGLALVTDAASEGAPSLLQRTPPGGFDIGGTMRGRGFALSGRRVADGGSACPRHSAGWWARENPRRWRWAVLFGWAVDRLRRPVV